MSTPRRVLLAVAVEQEAVHLPADLPRVVLGVGKVNAALAVAGALADPRSRPDLVLNLGTAGALRPGWEGTHEIGVVAQHDLDSVVLEQLTGYRYGAPIVLGDGARLATGDMFVTDAAVRDRIAERADLVDMEGYAVAAACRAAGVDVRLVKHVTDSADSGARQAWVDTVQDASQALATWLEAFLAGRP
jgi:adenosylhomocysteine nucleosidase